MDISCKLGASVDRTAACTRFSAVERGLLNGSRTRPNCWFLRVWKRGVDHMDSLWYNTTINNVRMSDFAHARAPPPRTIDRNHEVGPAARRRRVRPPEDDRDVSTCSIIYTKRGDLVRGAFERRPPASRKSGSSSIVLFGAVPGGVFRRYGVVLHVGSDWWSLRGGDGRMVSGRRVGQSGWTASTSPTSRHVRVEVSSTPSRRPASKSSQTSWAPSHCCLQGAGTHTLSVAARDTTPR
jgi:hypothetical protein